MKWLKQLAVCRDHKIMLPVVVASSVIRSSQQGESHGGVYLVNLESGQVNQVIDWNDQSISWEGRGWDRGLRGIAFHKDHIYLAASDEIFVYDQQFRITNSFVNPFLKHCHEIRVVGDKLFLTSTGFDSILVFDLNHRIFERGLYIKKQEHTGYDTVEVIEYDPLSLSGPEASMNCHINNVYVDQERLFIAGTRLDSLYVIQSGTIQKYAKLPYGSHNAQPFENGILCNDTADDKVVKFDLQGNTLETYPIMKYPEQQLTWTHLTNDRARQAFGRGLVVTNDGYVIGGSSPSTISVYQRGNCATYE